MCTLQQSTKTPLHIACENNHPQLVSLLLDRGADPHVMDLVSSLIHSFIHSSIHLFHLSSSLFSHLLSVCLFGDDEFILWCQSQSLPLHYACARGSVEAVSLLLENGSNVDEKDFVS
jgi:ankyrin repeat protein